MVAIEESSYRREDEEKIALMQQWRDAMRREETSAQHHCQHA